MKGITLKYRKGEWINVVVEIYQDLYLVLKADEIFLFDERGYSLKIRSINQFKAELESSKEIKWRSESRKQEHIKECEQILAVWTSIRRNHLIDSIQDTSDPFQSYILAC